MTFLPAIWTSEIPVGRTLPSLPLSSDVYYVRRYGKEAPPAAVKAHQERGETEAFSSAANRSRDTFPTQFVKISFRKKSKIIIFRKSS